MTVQQPDYSKIFASGAATGELLNWPDEEYLRGWGYLQPNEPPPMEFFNSMQNLNDRKMQYLFETVNVRKNSTRYTVNSIVTTPNLASMYYLVCVEEGTTDITEPSWISATEGAEITDGTCRWRVTSKLSTGVTVSDEEPVNAQDNAVWFALQEESAATVKYKAAGIWKALAIVTELSRVLDSPIKSLKRNATYKIDDICAVTTLSKGGYLVCTTAGTTAASLPSGYASATEGAEITDGTAVFKVRLFESLAPKASPAFTGTPTAPTAAKGTNTDQIATMKAIINALADYAKLASPAFTGAPTAPTAAKGTNTTQIATTAFVAAAVSAALGDIDLSPYAKKTDLSAYAPKASPAFTGTPTAPTAASTTNNTQIATTAFVKALVGASKNGGIVAANLAQNGYVKFANGLILQWGYANGSSATITFPIAFAVACYQVIPVVQANNRNSGYDRAPFYVANKTKTSCTFGSADDAKVWFAIGK